MSYYLIEFGLIPNDTMQCSGSSIALLSWRQAYDWASAKAVCLKNNGMQHCS